MEHNQYLNIPFIWGTFTRSICSIDVEGYRPRIFWIWLMDLVQLLHISVLENVEFNTNIKNDA
jgi:hypothetical protein